jgi:hypothetical protein
MAKYQIETTLNAGTSSTVELPEGKKWSDVQDWFVKWDTLHIRFRGDTDDTEILLDSATDPEMVDWKRPMSVIVFEVDETGETNYYNVVDETK